MPGYRAMLESVFERVGWDASQFQIKRIEMKYPPVPSNLMVQFPLAYGAYGVAHQSE